MGSHRQQLVKSFFALFVFTCAGIFLHELSHHLFGIPSLLGFSRNYPLVPISEANMDQALVGSLAGPVTNLLFAYIGLFLYKSYRNHRILGRFSLYFGVANSFLVLSSSVINFVVDVISRSMGNDLEKVSVILGIHILILPAIFTLLSLIPFKAFWRDSTQVAPSKVSFMAIIFLSWLAGGLFLMSLDALFAGIYIELLMTMGCLLVDKIPFSW